MKTTPFTTTDVKALIEGMKTRFSLKMRKQPDENNKLISHLHQTCLNLNEEWERCGPVLDLAPLKVGDRVGIKEAWAWIDNSDFDGEPSYYEYKADKPEAKYPAGWDNAAFEDEVPEYARWRSPIHMPPEAIRIYVEITEVKAFRLQEITEEDAIAEGVGAGFVMNAGWPDYMHIRNGICELTQDTAYASYISFLERYKGKKFWNSNPWMWSFGFRVLTTKGERG